MSTTEAPFTYGRRTMAGHEVIVARQIVGHVDRLPDDGAYATATSGETTYHEDTEAAACFLARQAVTL